MTISIKGMVIDGVKVDSMAARCSKCQKAFNVNLGANMNMQCPQCGSKAIQLLAKAGD